MINPKAGGPAIYEAPEVVGALFADDFQNGLDKWTHSEVGQYSGRFQVGQGADPAISGDQALIIPKKANHYALTAPVPGLEDMTGKDFALSYEVKLDDGMTCGGAYVKMPTEGFPGGEKFESSVKYSVMFGPDKCGSTEKVHFILQSKNPISGELVEHHLKNPPALGTSYDKHHHLYSLYVTKDGKFEVHVDGEAKREGSLMEEFEPPIQPSKEIDDKDDKKPDTWVDEEKIEDPNAVKPDDWDEDAPEEIPDLDATMPDDWLVDEPAKIKDLKDKKPEDWDDEKDGEWSAKMIPNPKCAEVSGCGEWKPPMKHNPDWKGKWTPPMIDNPDYVGEWKPRKIANPDYYEVKQPKLLPMHAIGLEIWTMDQGVLFDDFYVGTDIDKAKAYAKAAYEPKKKAGEAKDKEEQKKAEEESAKQAAEQDGTGPLAAAKRFVRKIEGYVDYVESKLVFLEDVIEKAGLGNALEKLVDMGISKPMTVVVMTPIVMVALFLIVLAGGKKKPSAALQADAIAKKTDKVTKDDDEVSKSVENESEESEIVESETTEEPEKTTRRRRAKVE